MPRGRRPAQIEREMKAQGKWLKLPVVLTHKWQPHSKSKSEATPLQLQFAAERTGRLDRQTAAMLPGFCISHKVPCANLESPCPSRKGERKRGRRVAGTPDQAGSLHRETFLKFPPVASVSQSLALRLYKPF